MPLTICISCIVILGASLYNMMLMMFGGKELVSISSNIEELCCIAGTWFCWLNRFRNLVIVGGAILKLLSKKEHIKNG